MQLHCPDCRAKILVDDINLANRMAKCRGCNSVFEFAASSQPAREPAPRPTKFKVSEREGELEISWRWFKVHHVFLAVFCTAWDAFLVFWYGMAFRSGAPWIMKVFPIGHLAVGVGLTYVTLAGFWNRTTLRVARERLQVEHGPLPWRGRRELALGDLRRIYAAARPNFSRNGMPGYQLLAVTKAGEEVRLLTSLEDPTQAEYLAEKLGPFVS